jgi:hypothetical protein
MSGSEGQMNRSKCGPGTIQRSEVRDQMSALSKRTKPVVTARSRLAGHARRTTSPSHPLTLSPSHARAAPGNARAPLFRLRFGLWFWRPPLSHFGVSAFGRF